MRAELERISKIEQYLMGTLSSSERANFNKDLNQNPELKLNLEFQKQLVESIRQIALKNQAVKAHVRYKRIRFLKVATIAVIVASAVSSITYLWLNQTEPDSHKPQPEEYIEGTAEIPANDPTVISDSVTETIPPNTTTILQHSEQTESDHKASNTQHKIQPSNVNNASIETTSKIELDNPRVADTYFNGSPLSKNLENRVDKSFCEWTISSLTTREQLKQIQVSINQCEGNLTVKRLNYKSGLLKDISFTLEGAQGEVTYHSPELNNGLIVCISLEDGVHAGLCDGRTGAHRKTRKTGLTEKEDENLRAFLSDSTARESIDTVQMNNSPADKYPARKLPYKRGRRYTTE